MTRNNNKIVNAVYILVSAFNRNKVVNWTLELIIRKW
jgi:hypothetical protein